MKGMKTLINLLTSIRWAYLYLFASYLKHFLLETYPCDAPVRRWRCTRTKWQCLLYRRTKLRRSTCQGILGPTGKHKLPRQDGRWEAPVGVTGAGSTSNSTQGEGLGLERTPIYALCLNKKISLSLNIILCYLLSVHSFLLDLWTVTYLILPIKICTNFCIVSVLFSYVTLFI